jgi:hypothetical protein
MPKLSRPSTPPAIAAAILAGGIAAPLILSASAAWADPGDIKVHAVGTAFNVQANNPKPGCQFYIAAFGVTAGQTYRITFTPQPANSHGPAGKPTTASDTYKATMNISKNGKTGDGRSRTFNPDPAHPEIHTGQYKITAVNVNDPGDRKTKVLRLDCTEETGTGGTSGGPSGGGDNGSVGGVGNPQSGDNGPGAVGGVATGGGGLANNPVGVDVTGPLLLAGLGGTVLVGGALRRRGA